jgi:DNA-3-methyladenine glycosylase II
VLVRPHGPFSLQVSLDLLAGFAPAGARPSPTHPDRFLAEPHVVEGLAVTVRAEQREDGAVEVSPDAAGPLVRRMLCLDWDGDAFAALPDPVLARVRVAHPGLRPVLFATPWEAGAWALIGHRIAMTQAARIKDRIRDRLGPEVEGRHAFPPPAAVADDELPELPAVKAERLRALAARGDAGELEPELLLGKPPEEAVAWLQSSPGIGPWMSWFVLIRGAGHPDLTPPREPRLEAAVVEAYGEPLSVVSERWTPFRSWAAFLFRVSAGS